jgi:hypothetical protein
VLADAPVPVPLVAAPVTPPMSPPAAEKRLQQLSEQKLPSAGRSERHCRASDGNGWGVKPQPKSAAKPAALAASRAATLQKSVEDLCMALRSTAELDEAAAAAAADELEQAARAYDRAEAAAAAAAAAAASDAAAADAAAKDAAAAEAAAAEAAAQQAAAEREAYELRAAEEAEAEAEAEESAAAAWAAHDMQIARAHYERAAAAAEAAGAAAAGWHLAAYGAGSSSSSTLRPAARLSTSAFWSQFHGDARSEKRRRRAELHQSGLMPPKTWLPGPLAVGQACGQCQMRHFALGCSHSLCGVCCVPPCSWHMRQLMLPR